MNHLAKAAFFRQSVFSPGLLSMTVAVGLATGAVFAPPGVVPVLLSIVVAVIFFSALRKKNRGVVPVEIGSFYFTIVFLYCALPFAIYAINGFTYHLLSDARLYQANPSQGDLLYIGYHYILYLAVFAFSYLLFRKPATGFVGQQYYRASMSMVVLLIIAYLLLEFPLLTLKYSVLGTLVPEDYGQEYLWMKDLPQIVQQLLNHAGAIGFSIQIFIVTYLLLDYRRTKLLIVALLGVKFVIVTMTHGARTEFAALLVGAVVCYYNFVKPLTLWKAVIVGVVLVGLFLGLGWSRDFQGASHGVPAAYLPSTEFESLFANAYDVQARKRAGEVDAPELYPVEGIINLMPQQLWPFEKPSLSTWYVNTFYPVYQQTGGGFAFGVISESLLSESTWLAVVWRAVFHGALLAAAFNLFHRSRRSPIHVAIYIWMTVVSYQLFRDTTFSLVSRAFYDLLPVILLVYGIPILARPRPAEPSS